MGSISLVDNLTAEQRKQIRNAVEDALERYRLYKYSQFKRREASITQSYEPRYHGPTNVPSDQTAKIAVYNVDEPEQRKIYCEHLERAVSRLTGLERDIMENQLEKDPQYDVILYDTWGISHTTYDQYRMNGVFKIAMALKIISIDKGGISIGQIN